MWGEKRQVGVARRNDLFFVFPEKISGARKNHFAVSSLNELRAFIRGGPAHHKETQIPRDNEKSCMRTSKPLSQNAIFRGI